MFLHVFSLLNKVRTLTRYISKCKLLEWRRTYVWLEERDLSRVRIWLLRCVSVRVEGRIWACIMYNSGTSPVLGTRLSVSHAKVFIVPGGQAEAGKGSPYRDALTLYSELPGPL